MRTRAAGLARAFLWMVAAMLLTYAMSRSVYADGYVSFALNNGVFPIKRHFFSRVPTGITDTAGSWSLNWVLEKNGNLTIEGRAFDTSHVLGRNDNFEAVITFYGHDHREIGYSHMVHLLESGSSWSERVPPEVMRNLCYLSLHVRNNGALAVIDQSESKPMHCQHAPGSVISSNTQASRYDHLYAEGWDAIVGKLRTDGHEHGSYPGAMYCLRRGRPNAVFCDNVPWGTCPNGYISLANLGARNDGIRSESFWLCVRNEYLEQTYYFGNVVNDAGFLYKITRSKTELVGPAGWESPRDQGDLLGMAFYGNGFWVRRK